MIRYAIGTCRFGALLIAADEAGVCAVALGDDADAALADLRVRFPAHPLADDPSLGPWLHAVAVTIDAPGTPLDLPLAPRGTPFQQRVWDELRGIPAGSTTTYTAVARALGAPGSVRAVATAVAANPLAVLIPCHRVVGRDGALTGYRWGLPRKRALLTEEVRRAGGPALLLHAPAPSADG